MQKITIGTSDGKLHAFIAPPVFVNACWREVFGAFQQLGTKAMSMIEVVTTEPVNIRTVKVKVVISLREERREFTFEADPAVETQIKSKVVETFWALTRDMQIVIESKLSAFKNIPDFSKNPCKRCGNSMIKNPSDSFFCLACSGMEVATSDWILEPLPTAMPVFAEDVAQKTCPSCVDFAIVYWFRQK
jgi:hypothetical protein